MALAYQTNNDEFHIKIHKGQIGRYVLLCGDPGRVEKIAAYLENAEFVQQNREYTIYTGTLSGVPVSVCSHGIGGPSTAIAVEELIHCGADTFIRVGTAGGMREDVMAGDLCIATGAIRAEGTSREYAPIEWPAVADYAVVGALKEAADRLGFRSHVGVVHCKDNFYGEHDPSSMPMAGELNFKWNAWMALGALCSEMECSTLFTVAAARNVRAGGILCAFGNQTRRAKGLEDSITFDVDASIRAGVEAMRILVERDIDV